MTAANSINESTTGITGFTGTAFVGTPTTAHAVLVGGSTSSTLANVGPTSTAGQVLQSAGASADPAFSTATYPATATGTGTILRADGTNWSATTSTYPNTNAANTLLYASSANVMAALPTAANSTLVTDGSSVPSLSQTLPTAVQGNITSVGTISSGTWAGTTITVDHGGTGRTTLTAHGVLVGNGTTAITQLSAGSAGQVLQSGGASADPVYSTATYPATATGTGTILRADGTNWSATTTTYPNTNAVNTLLYASSANVMAALATAANSVLATDGSGVPSISATPRVTSITFDGSNLLGTYIATTSWTPTLLPSGTNYTSLTYTTQAGQYIQIGKLVIAYFNVVVNAVTLGGASGALQIASFPVTSANLSNIAYPGAISIGTLASLGTTPLYYTAAFVNNSTLCQVNITHSATGTSVSSLAATAIQASSQFVGMAIYFAA